MGIEEIKAQMERERRLWDEAHEKNKTLEKGLVVGKVFRIQVIDSYALYEVTKVGVRNASVIHRTDINGDYMDPILGAGGSFPAKVIRRIIEGEEGLADFFSKN